jgi:hypothetical protein
MNFRFWLAGLLLCELVSATVGCSRIEPTWQAAPGQPNQAVRIYATRVHTILSLPLPQSSTRATTGTEEWAFGQKLWYYDDRQQPLAGVNYALHRVWGFVRAGVWPSPGIIEVVHPQKALPVREPGLVRREWTFNVAPEKVAAMRAWLEASKNGAAIDQDTESAYFPAQKRYWAFYTCHHYAAQALRAGGIPAGVGRCWLPWEFWGQLDELEEAQEESVAPPAP